MAVSHLFLHLPCLWVGGKEVSCIKAIALFGHSYTGLDALRVGGSYLDMDWKFLLLGHLWATNWCGGGNNILTDLRHYRC